MFVLFLRDKIDVFLKLENTVKQILSETKNATNLNVNKKRAIVWSKGGLRGAF